MPTSSLSAFLQVCPGLLNPPTSTPPFNIMGGGKIQVCEDTVYVHVRGNFTLFEQIREKIAEAKEKAKSAREERWAAELCGRTFFVSRKQPGGFHKFLIEWDGVRILWNGNAEAVEKQFNLVFQIGSIRLWKAGGLGGVWHEIQCLMAEWGVIIEDNLLGRVDTAIDVHGVPVSEFIRRIQTRCAVSRATAIEPYGDIGIGADEHTAGKIKAQSVSSYVPYMVGQEYSGVRIGKETQLVIYDKVREVGKDPVKKAFFDQVWGREPGDEEEREVTRVEFRLTREMLGDCLVRTVEEYLGHRRNILAYLLRQWFRLCAEPVQRNHTIRAELWSVWQRMIEAVEMALGKPVLQKVRVDGVVIDTEGIRRQIMGCVATVVAWKRGRKLTADELTCAVYDELMSVFNGPDLTEMRDKVDSRIDRMRACGILPEMKAVA